MFVVERTIVRRMRFDECNHQNERVTLMFLDKLARALLEKFWSRQLNRQVTDGYLREPSILFVRRDSFRDEKICVIAVVVSRNPLLKSAFGRPFFAEVPLSDVSSAVILVGHQLRQNVKPSIERHA